MRALSSAHPDAVLLLRSLQKGFVRALALAPPVHASVGRPLSAFLVLERWRDNPLAEHLQEHHPLLADERVDVPDDIYKGRPEAAPTLVPMPEHWAADAPGDDTLALLNTMALALDAARLQSRRRLVDQMLCAVVFSAATPARIALHWKHLGFQISPEDGKDKLFRYQDARVMQRVWPLLDEAQRRRWLGPVTAWWSLSQPWGPWAGAEAFATTEAAAGGAAEATEWFVADRPALPHVSTPDSSDEALHRLLRLDQWRAAHTATTGNRLWLSMASRKISTRHQPDGETMTRLLRQGAELGLTQESDLCEFVDASWPAHRPGDPVVQRDWSAPRDAALLQQALASMHATGARTGEAGGDPPAGFASSLYAAAQAQPPHPFTPRKG
ncbi:DUF4123 domain-containing protein [Variovorax boronicumulans]|uniref:DUF4123 domain-containing protein n=1 Tax=Variovorax boronicumulans TaxID=436515 RepID=UPI003398D8B3